jgi:hypothetical protein
MIELDEALERFQKCDLEFMGGLANHGPMAAEALVALGHGALIAGFVDAYAPLIPPLEPGRPIPENERAAALGRPERLADWVATFESELLADADWRAVLARSCSELLPGLFAGATHGLLRAAHAVRSLDQADTPPRRRELAFGLAYWAGRYQPLPGVPGARAQRGRGPLASLRALPAVAVARRRPGFFFDAVRVLDDDPAFVESVELADPADRTVSLLLSELCRAAASLYLANPAARIAYVHTLTAPSALRLLAPHLPQDALRAAFGYAFQAAAALHAVSAENPATAGLALDSAPRVASEVERLAEDAAGIRYRAACSLEEHAIKFSEACLREDAIAPDPIFRLAAADAALHLQAPAGRRAC